VTPHYWRRILPKLDPRLVVPTHYDNFFSPLGRPQDYVRRVHLADVAGEVHQVARDAQVAALPRVDA
jgi:L-ascorbate metabolism protein UlaG (beta-lactamase superfamily)